MIQNSEKFFIIKIKRMTKKSNVLVEMLHSIGDTPEVVAVTHEDGKAKEISLNIQPMYNKLTFMSVLFLMFLGVVMVFYIIINFAFYLRSLPLSS